MKIKTMPSEIVTLITLFQTSTFKKYGKITLMMMLKSQLLKGIHPSPTMSQNIQMRARCKNISSNYVWKDPFPCLDGVLWTHPSGDAYIRQWTESSQCQVVLSASSRHINTCWLQIYRAPVNELKFDLNHNSTIFVAKMRVKLLSVKLAISFRLHCINIRVINEIMVWFWRRIRMTWKWKHYHCSLYCLQLYAGFFS